MSLFAYLLSICNMTQVEMSDDQYSFVLISRFTAGIITDFITIHQASTKNSLLYDGLLHSITTETRDDIVLYFNAKILT